MFLSFSPKPWIIALTCMLHMVGGLWLEIPKNSQQNKKREILDSTNESRRNHLKIIEKQVIDIFTWDGNFECKPQWLYFSP